MSEDRQTELMNIFVKAFCKYGLEGTTTKKLAAEANLSEAGLYVYFKNKEDIMTKCVEFIMGNALKETQLLLKKHGDDPEAFVWKMFHYVNSKLEEERFAFEYMLHPNYRPLNDSLRKQLLDNLQQQSEKLQDYYFSKKDGYAMTLLLNSALHNYVFTQDEDGFRFQMEFLLKLIKK
jgi:Transcriptional regulator